jgi:hypothetical protein
VSASLNVRFDSNKAREALRKLDDAIEKNTNDMLSALGTKIVDGVHDHKGKYFKDDTGALKNSVRKVSATGGVLELLSSGVAYAFWVHEGTSPHTIYPKKRKRLRWVNGSGDFVFARKVNHPGTSKRPFLLDAYRDNQEWAEAETLQKIKLSFLQAGI